jgi:hypothetical protein
MLWLIVSRSFSENFNKVGSKGAPQELLANYLEVSIVIKNFFQSDVLAREPLLREGSVWLTSFR